MVKFVMSSSHLHESFSPGEVIRLLVIGAGKMGRAHAAAFASELPRAVRLPPGRSSRGAPRMAALGFASDLSGDDAEGSRLRVRCGDRSGDEQGARTSSGGGLEGR